MASGYCVQFSTYTATVDTIFINYDSGNTRWILRFGGLHIIWMGELSGTSPLGQYTKLSGVEPTATFTVVGYTP